MKTLKIPFQTVENSHGETAATKIKGRMLKPLLVVLMLFWIMTLTSCAFWIRGPRDGYDHQDRHEHHYNNGRNDHNDHRDHHEHHD